MKIRTFHASFVSISTVLIKVMAKNLNILCTCRGSASMANIYVVMVGIAVYEYPQCENVYVQTCKCMSIAEVILKHFRLGL